MLSPMGSLMCSYAPRLYDLGWISLTRTRSLWIVRIRFGLAQLYQLRGRVGRGAQRAFAYLFRSAKHQPTPEGQERLEVLAEKCSAWGWLRNCHAGLGDAPGLEICWERANPGTLPRWAFNFTRGCSLRQSVLCALRLVCQQKQELRAVALVG